MKNDLENEVKEGVDFVFEQNPELAKVGTMKQYSEYLENIFPESKVRNICYHQTPQKFEKFNFEKSRTGGIYFSPFNWPTPLVARILFDLPIYGTIKNYTKAVLFNTKNPFIISKKQNKKIERHLPNMSKLSKKVDLKKYDGIIGFSNVFYDKGQLDSDIINVSSDRRNNIEFIAYEPSQIHILGSKFDIEKFKEYISKVKI